MQIFKLKNGWENVYYVKVNKGVDVIILILNKVDLRGKLFFEM